MQSIMLFECITWEMDKGMRQLIDSFKRKMIRQACGIFWLNRISTEKVNTLAEPASQIVAKRRWQMLGHILRTNEQVSTNRATMECLASKKTKRKTKHQSSSNHQKRPKSLKLTLNEAIELAQNRKRWKLEGSML